MSFSNGARANIKPQAPGASAVFAHAHCPSRSFSQCECRSAECRLVLTLPRVSTLIWPNPVLLYSFISFILRNRSELNALLYLRVGFKEKKWKVIKVKFVVGAAAVCETDRRSDRQTDRQVAGWRVEPLWSALWSLTQWWIRTLRSEGAVPRSLPPPPPPHLGNTCASSLHLSGRWTPRPLQVRHTALSIITVLC